MCENKLINTLQTYVGSINNAVGSGNVASESTDGYSVSYISASEISEVVKSKNDEIDDTIRDYLTGVIVNGEHVIYCGIK